MFQHIVNSCPEVNKPLSAKFVKSFAYPTFKERIPGIIQNIVNDLQNKDEIKKHYGEKALKEVDIIIQKINKLKNDMVTDQPLEEINANGRFTREVSAYNRLLREKQDKNRGNPPTWFQTEWLFAECYLYFKLHEIFYVSETLSKYDPFLKVKVDTLLASEGPVLKLSKYIVDYQTKGSLGEKEKKEKFIYLLMCSLWGNKADLSLSGGKAVAASDDIYSQMSTLGEYILVNDLEEAYNVLKNPDGNVIVDIILDNAGYELFNDLCFADFLIWSGLVKKVIFHGKGIPWFVSDVTLRDFNLIFELLSDNIKSNDTIALVKQWTNYLKNEQWEFKSESFWILPYDFSEMPTKDPELYAKLGENKLSIFKGDLNYRKLVGDIFWDPTTSFADALRGFRPTNVLALRTVKADTISGLEKGVFEHLSQKDPSWMITGQYALIQFLKSK